MSLVKSGFKNLFSNFVSPRELYTVFIVSVRGQYCDPFFKQATGGYVVRGAIWVFILAFVLFLALCVFHRKWDHLKTAILTFRMNILTVNTVINYSEMVFWWKSCFNVKHSPSIKPYNHVTTRPRGYLVITYVYLTPKFASMTFSHLGLLGVLQYAVLNVFPQKFSSASSSVYVYYYLKPSNEN